ncbi:MAG: nucleoside deaminase [Patescibacteria group bacterium]|nr:nucleoside deaminase [Patescibacteria group bacterium]
MKGDQKYRDEILRLARKAYSANEVPVGAIVVDGDGTIIGRGFNQTHTKKDGLRHAELVAIRMAQRKVGDWRLEKASIYITLEPCLMCLGAIGNARIKNLYYILSDPLFGSVASKLTKAKVRQLFPGLNIEKLSGGTEVGQLMREFFKKLRK